MPSATSTAKKNDAGNAKADKQASVKNSAVSPINLSTVDVGLSLPLSTGVKYSQNSVDDTFAIQRQMATGFSQGTSPSMTAADTAPSTELNSTSTTNKAIRSQSLPGISAFSQTNPLTIQRKANADSSSSSSPSVSACTSSTSRESELLVEDDLLILLPGQMRKSAFLGELRSAVDTAIDSELSGTVFALTGFPWIGQWFRRMDDKSAEQIQRTLIRYAPEIETVESAQESILIISRRARQAVATWLATGEISSLPEEIIDQVPRQSGGILSAISGLLFKKRSGTSNSQSSNPHAVKSQLNNGAPLDSGVRSSVESAYGQSFSDVRVHTDSAAGKLSNDFNARAFTVGQDVAFSQGEYRPGTLVGDTLIAHELAHVAQQRGSGASAPMHKSKLPTDHQGLESEADGAALGAVSSMWGLSKEDVMEDEETATLNLTPGLKVQRCGGNDYEGSVIESVYTEDFSFNNDDFAIEFTWEHVERENLDVAYLRVNITYAGEGRADSSGFGDLTEFRNYSGPLPDPQAEAASDSLVRIDVFGNGTHFVEVTNELFTHNDWSPPSHWHNFDILFDGESSGRGQRQVTVLDRNAVPVADGITIEEEELTTQAEAALESMATGIDDVDNLLSIAISDLRFFADDSVVGPSPIEGSDREPWDRLVAILLTSQTRLSENNDPDSETTLQEKLERFMRYLRLTRRITTNLQQLRDSSGYIADIADDVDALVQYVIAQYHGATLSAFDNPEQAMATLRQAEIATQALPYNLASLYVQEDHGVEKFGRDINSLRLQIEAARARTGRARGDRPIHTYLGIIESNTPTIRDPAISEPAERLRRQLFSGGSSAGGNNILRQVSDHVQYSQHRLAAFATIALLEQFRYFKQELNGITGDVLDVLGRDLEVVCDGYISQLEGWVDRAEPVWAPTATDTSRISVMGGIASEFTAMVSPESFNSDIQAIQDRLETIAVIEMVAKVVAIVAASALVANVAGAAMAVGLEGAGIGGATAWGLVTFTEALAFTFTSRLGNEVVFGGNETSFGHDLVLNLILFSYLKGANAIYSRVLARLAMMESAALLAGRVAPALARAQQVGQSAITHGVYTFGALQAFSEVHYMATHGGDVMDGEERTRTMFTTATIVVVLGLGRNLQTELTARVQAPIRRFFLSRYARQIDALEAERVAVIELMAEVEGGNSARASELARRIQSLNEAETRAISRAEGAEGVTGDMISAELARYQRSLESAELQLAQSGVEHAGGQADLFRQMGDGMVAYNEGGADVARSFFEEHGGRIEQGERGILIGRLGAEIVTFIPETMASRAGLIEVALARTATAAEGMAYVRSRLSMRALRGLEESARDETPQETFNRLLELEQRGVNIETHLEATISESSSRSLHPEFPSEETDPATYLDNVDAYIGQLARGLPAESGLRIRAIEEMGLRGDLRYELIVRILDPLFNSAARRTASSAHRAHEAETSTSSNIIPDFNRIQADMLRTLRDADLSVEAKQLALERSLSELEALVSGSEYITDARAYRFADARTGIEGINAENFGDTLRVDSTGRVFQGERELGTFRTLLDQIVETNNSLMERGVDREMVVSVGEPTVQGFRDLMIVSRGIADPAQPRPDTPVQALDPSVSREGLILDIGSGTSAFALEMVPEIAREGGPVVQTEYGPNSFEPGLLRRDLGPHMNAVPRRDGRSVTVFGDPLQNMSLLYGPDSIRLMFLNNVNASYSVRQYLALARNLMSVMQEGGRVEVQWDSTPEEPGGTPGDRGHIDGPALRDALLTVQGETGRSFSVNTENGPITDYDYSIEPSRYRGGPRGPTDVTSPVPEFRWIFTFAERAVYGPVMPTTTPPNSDRGDSTPTIPESLRRE